MKKKSPKRKPKAKPAFTEADLLSDHDFEQLAQFVAHRVVNQGGAYWNALLVRLNTTRVLARAMRPRA